MVLQPNYGGRGFTIRDQQKAFAAGGGQEAYQKLLAKKRASLKPGEKLTESQKGAIWKQIADRGTRTLQQQANQQANSRRMIEARTSREGGQQRMDAARARARQTLLNAGYTAQEIKGMKLGSRAHPNQFAQAHIEKHGSRTDKPKTKPDKVKYPTADETRAAAAERNQQRGPAPAPEKSARQKEIESIRADKSLSDMDKFVKANRSMIEKVGTKRQREMLADYNRRHSGGDKKPDANKVKKSNFGTKTGVDTKKYEVKNKKRYDTSKVGGKFKKDLGVETGKYRVKSGNPKRRDTSEVKGSNFGRDTGVDTKKYDLPNKDANKDKLRFTTSKLKGIDTKDYSDKVKKKPNFADKLKKVTGKFTR